MHNYSSTPSVSIQVVVIVDLSVIVSGFKECLYLWTDWFKIEKALSFNQHNLARMEWQRQINSTHGLVSFPDPTSSFPDPKRWGLGTRLPMDDVCVCSV